MKYAGLILLIGIGIMLIGSSAAVAKDLRAGCVTDKYKDGSGSETNKYYCPDRYVPGHRTDHYVEERPTPPTPIQRHVVREYQPPYYRVPTYQPTYYYYDYPTYNYHYSTYNPYYPYYYYPYPDYEIQDRRAF